jgi:hypothetical protein
MPSTPPNPAARARRWLARSLAMVATFALLLASAYAQSPRVAKSKKYEKTKKTVAGGTSWRIKTPKGPVYVWIPAGYDRDSAGMVVYIHGYGTSADRAWKNHKLPQQFRKSRQNAMFIVVEGPSSNEAAIKWHALGGLKRAVRRGGIRLPDGPSIVMAHSGGFRTVAKWLDNRLLAQVILLDALYGRKQAFSEFIDSGKRAKHHKLIIIAAGTVANARAFAKKFRYAVVGEKIPSSYAKFSKRQRRAKLLYLRSQYGHGQIVSGGKVIPLILRLTPLKHL